MAGWSAHLITVLIGFFLMPFILGTVGEAQYGAWVFINAVAGYSTLIYSGLGATICRFVADLSSRRDWTKLNTIVSTILAIYFVTATLVIAMTSLFAWWAPALNKWGELPIGEIQISIFIVGCTIGLGMIFSVYGGVLVGTQRIAVMHGIEVTMGIVRLLLTVLCLHQQYGLITLSLIFFSATTVQHLIIAWFAYRQIPQLSIAPWKASRAAFSECMGFSFFNAIAQFAEYLIYFTDTIIIGLILGPLAVVPYQIALRIAQMIQIPIAQIGEAVLPKAGELYVLNDRNGLANLVHRGMGIAFLLSGGFLIGSWYFGELLIRTWIGQQFTDSYTILVILVASQLIALPMVVVRKALLGIGQVRVQAWIDLFEAFVNLVFSLIFIYWWGVIGVALGTLIPLYLVEVSLLLPYAMRQLGLSRQELWRTVVAPQIPAFAALIVFCDFAFPRTPQSGWIPLLCVTVGGGIALLSVRGGMMLLERRSQRTFLNHDMNPLSGSV
ncbi:MAG TPA: polysaccharide biosynthesis C-terminal domain-containing protein [Planctomicrobium sp.]|nr:polysaccharide biosynthesis C-terminal domain-containing protein [Planctomicrobium sp.]